MDKIDNKKLFCKYGECNKFENGQPLCDDCIYKEFVETWHKIQCAGCEHRLRCASLDSEGTHDESIKASDDYTLFRGETCAEFCRNNCEFVTIYYDGRWAYEDGFISDSYEEGIFCTKGGEVPIIESNTSTISNSAKEAVEAALKALGYVKA
jgi:hypothetical protein